MSFLNFIKKYYFATNELFSESRGRNKLIKSESEGRNILTKSERKVSIFIIYGLLGLLLLILFIFLNHNVKILLIYFLLLYFYIDFIVNFNIFRILIIYFIYKKNNAIIRIFEMIYFEQNSDLLLQKFRGIIKQLVISKDYFNICKIKIFGFLDKENIVLIFKVNKIIICFKENKKIIKNIPLNLNQLFENLVDDIKALKTI